MIRHILLWQCTEAGPSNRTRKEKRALLDGKFKAMIGKGWWTGF